MTYGKFENGFAGCVKRVFFKNRKLKLQTDATQGWNTLPCVSDFAEYVTITGVQPNFHDHQAG